MWCWVMLEFWSLQNETALLSTVDIQLRSQKSHILEVTTAKSKSDVLVLRRKTEYTDTIMHEIKPDSGVFSNPNNQFSDSLDTNQVLNK